MVQTIQARNFALYELETNFKIEWVEDDQFFREWQDDLPEISELASKSGHGSAVSLPENRQFLCTRYATIVQFFVGKRHCRVLFFL